MVIRRSAEDRFWEKVDRRGPDECWLWTASTCGGNYGQFSVEGSPRKAHRFAYELLVGPIPEGLSLDHECHNRDESCSGGECSHRLCVNPTHLVPRTHAENVRRGRAPAATRARFADRLCARGHEMLPGKRQSWCPTCDRERRRRGSCADCGEPIKTEATR